MSSVSVSVADYLSLIILVMYENRGKETISGFLPLEEANAQFRLFVCPIAQSLPLTHNKVRLQPYILVTTIHTAQEKHFIVSYCLCGHIIEISETR